MKTLLALALLACSAFAQQAPQPPDPNNPFGPLVDSIVKRRQLRTEQEKARVQEDLMRAQTEAIRAELEREKQQRDAPPPAPLSHFDPPVNAAPPNTSCGLSNGRMWDQMTEASRLYFIIGASDGLLFGNVPVTYPNISWGEVRSAVDAVYSDPSNVLVPIIRALWIAKMRFEGTDPAKVGSMLGLMKRGAAICFEAK